MAATFLPRGLALVSAVFALACQPRGSSPADPSAPQTQAGAAPAVFVETPPARQQAEYELDALTGPRTGPIPNPASKPAPLAPAEADPRIESIAISIASTARTDPAYPKQVHQLGRVQAQKAAWLARHAASNQAQVEDAWTQAILTFDELLVSASFASYAELDEVLFLTALGSGVLGEESKMQAAYMRLIQDFPSSPLIAYAYLEFANYYYDAGKLDLALKLYERVTQFKGSPVYAYSLYRLAWCHLGPIGQSEPRYDKSLNYFFTTIRAVEDGRAPNLEAGQALELAAQVDLVRAYVHAGKPSKAAAFLDKVAPARADELLVVLAEAYAAEGMHAERGTICKVLDSRGVLSCG